MIRIFDGRGTGKTGRLFLLVKEYNGILICANPNAMKVKAAAYGFKDMPIYSYDEYWNEKVYLCYEEDTPIFIDELEGFLKSWDPNIKGYSVSLD